MNRENEAFDIYHSNISVDEKLRLLKDLVLDLTNEMEAQDQNMHPEIHNKFSEALRLSKDFIRMLEHP